MFIQSSRLSVQIALFAWVNCALVLYAQVPARVANKSTQVSHMDRAMAALSIARSSAEAKLLDVSFEAVRRAGGKGPPVASVELGGLLGGRPRPGATNNPFGNNPAPTASTDIQFAKELVAISDLWAKQNADAEKCYLLFKEIVFPASRPNEAFLYTVDQTKNSNSIGSVSLEMPVPPAIGKCGAQCLIEWAAKCDMVADVRTLIDARAKMPGSAAASTVMSLLLALQTSKTHEDTEGIMKDISTRISIVLTSRESELVLSKAIELASELPADSPVITTFHSAVLDGIKSNNRSNQNRFTNYFLVERIKQAVEADDPKQTEMLIEVVRRQWDTIRAGNGSFVDSLEKSLYQSIANYAFRKKKVAFGFDYLKRGESSSSPVSLSGYGRLRSTNFVDMGNAIAKAMLSMAPSERYDGMKDFVWSQPALGLQLHSAYLPTETAPALFRFTRTLEPSRQLAQENVTSTSLIQWHIRDAISCGKLDEVRSKIEGLRSSKSDDALLAEMVLQLSQGLTVDVMPHLDSSAPADKPTLRRLGPSSGEPLILEIELAAAALKNEKTRAAGLNFCTQLVELSEKGSSTNILAWARSVLRDAEPTKQAAIAQAGQVLLNHWIPADDMRNADLLRCGLPKSFWLEREPGIWGNESGSPKEFLFLKYPLIGDFEIRVSAQDALMHEAALGFAGASFELTPSRNQIYLTTNNFTYGSVQSLQTMKADQSNDYVFKRSGDSMDLSINDQPAKSLRIPAENALFFAHLATSYRTVSHGVPKITGSPKIPRSVVLSQPNLLGWSAAFTSQTLPVLNLDVESSSSFSPVPRPSGDVPYDWRYADGEIQSVDHRRLMDEFRKQNSSSGSSLTSNVSVPTAKAERREAWMYFLRPLADEERIELEFYHEQGRFSIAPTLGRIAMLLDRPKTDLHWITSETNGEYFGIASDNRVNDSVAEQLRDVVLKENDWNQLSLRLDAGVVTLSINGNDTYRRQWETSFHHQFGFFHDPTQTHIRVRNIRLTGKWPEKLPANLMEMKQ